MDAPTEKGKVIVQLMKGGYIVGRFSYYDAKTKERAIQRGLARTLELLGDDLNPWECLYDEKGKRL